MKAPPQNQPSELRDYLAILRNRKWTILAVLVIVVGSATAVSFAQTPRYSSTSRLLMDAGSEDIDSPVRSVDVATESQVIPSEPVALLVQEELDLDIPIEDLLDEVEVELFPETLIVDVTYTSTDPDTAAAVAQAFAESYIDYRRAQALENLRVAQESIETRLDAASSQLEQVDRDLLRARENDDAGLVSTLERERNVLLARLGTLQERLNDLEPNETLQLLGGDVILSARVPTSASSPNHIRNGLLAVFLGLAAGIGMALVRERLDDRFRGRADIEQSLGAPVLATVPRFSGGKRKGASALITQTDPQSLASEFYRTLRTNLEFISSQRGIKSMLVTSPSAYEGKSVTTANLGVSLADAGYRVILVSSDLRRPTLESLFDAGSETGLSSALTTDAIDIWRYLIDPSVKNLRLLPCGSLASRPAELLASPRLKILIDALSEACDYLIFDSPPVLAVADASILASRLDAALLVIDAGKTHRSSAIRAKEELERAGGTIIGTVLNSFDPVASPYYRYDVPYYPPQESAGNGKGAPPKTSSKKRSIRGSRS